METHQIIGLVIVALLILLFIYVSTGGWFPLRNAFFKHIVKNHTYFISHCNQSKYAGAQVSAHEYYKSRDEDQYYSFPPEREFFKQKVYIYQYGVNRVTQEELAEGYLIRLWKWLFYKEKITYSVNLLTPTKYIKVKTSLI